MNIQSSKVELVKTVLDIDSKELINKVAKFIQKEKSDFWSEFGLFTTVLNKITK